MHSNAYDTMSRLLPKQFAGERVLDVGSLDVNGSYRPLIEQRGGRYVGLDIRAGKGVDIVADSTCYPIPDKRYRTIITGSTAEHVDDLWGWFRELTRILADEGSIYIHTHWKSAEHRYPCDYWRIMPDGMRYLAKSNGLTVTLCEKHDNGDIFAVLEK